MNDRTAAPASTGTRLRSLLCRNPPRLRLMRSALFRGHLRLMISLNVFQLSLWWLPSKMLVWFVDIMGRAGPQISQWLAAELCSHRRPATLLNACFISDANSSAAKSSGFLLRRFNAHCSVEFCFQYLRHYCCKITKQMRNTARIVFLFQTCKCAA